jgi:hypothetical protein
MHEGQGPIFIHARVDAARLPRVIPTRDGYGMKHRFLEASGKPAIF